MVVLPRLSRLPRFSSSGLFMLTGVSDRKARLMGERMSAADKRMVEGSVDTSDAE